MLGNYCGLKVKHMGVAFLSVTIYMQIPLIFTVAVFKISCVALHGVLVKIADYTSHNSHRTPGSWQVPIALRTEKVPVRYYYLK